MDKLMTDRSGIIGPIWGGFMGLGMLLIFMALINGLVSRFSSDNLTLQSRMNSVLNR